MAFTTAAQPGWAAGPHIDLQGDDVASLLRRVIMVATRVAWASGTSDPEDIVQHVCEELLNDLRRGRWPKNPVGWAATVARRRIWKDSRNYDRELPTTAQELSELATTSDDQTAEAAAQLDLARWMKSLPPPLAETIALQIAGYSTAEIAVRLGIPQRIVRRRLGQGLNILRAAWVNEMTIEALNFRAKEVGAGLERRGSAIPTSSPQGMIAAKEHEAHLALADLPPRQKQVLQLSRRGYRPAQIARLLGLSANTVRVNLHHARKRLQRNLDRLADRNTPGETDQDVGRA